MTRALHLMLLAGVALAPGLAQADTVPLSVRPSFRLGDAGVLCTAQVRPTDPRLQGIFDRSYQLTCRDAAAPVGSVIAVRRTVDLAREPSALPVGQLACRAEESATIENVGTVRAITCRDEAAALDYRRYAVQRGKTFYLAEGLAGYDPALKTGAGLGRHRPGAKGRGAGGDDRGQRPGRLCPDPGRIARCRRRPGRGLYPQQCRPLRRKRGVFRKSGEPGGQRAVVAGRGTRQPGAAAVEPRQFRRRRTAAWRAPRRPAREATG